MACLVVRGNVSIVLPRWQAQRVGGEYFSSLLSGSVFSRRQHFAALKAKLADVVGTSLTSLREYVMNH